MLSPEVSVFKLRTQDSLLRTDSSDEAKPAVVNGLDEAWRIGVILQCQAQFADRLGERVLGNGRVGPDGVEQLALGHQRPRTLDQVAEHGERLGSQWNGLQPTQ